MHIMEGFLPSPWWEIWFVISAPFLIIGLIQLKKLFAEHRDSIPLLAVSGAFIFVLSSLKLPSVTGSCSHPTGTGLSAILFGPFITSILGVIVLLYQALFLAHGGLTTLGANVFSMGIAGPLVAWAIYQAGNRTGLNTYVTVFLAAALADLFTYIVTSFQPRAGVPLGNRGDFRIFPCIRGHLCHHPDPAGNRGRCHHSPGLQVYCGTAARRPCEHQSPLAGTGGQAPGG